MKNRTGDIEKDYEPVILDAVFTSSFDSLLSRIVGKRASNQFYKLRNEIVAKLCARAQEHYKANLLQKDLGYFKSLKTATNVRDYLHSFAPHWIAATIYKEYPKLKKHLPKNYGVILAK